MKFLSRLFGKTDKPDVDPPPDLPPIAVPAVRATPQPDDRLTPGESLAHGMAPGLDRHRDYANSRPDTFVFLEGATDFNIAGLAYRTDVVVPFVRSARASIRGGRGWPEARAEREPGNAFDPNAIRILARLPTSRAEAHLGYVPADIAATIAARFTPDLPLAVVLRTIGVLDSGNMLIAAALFIPAAKDRKRFAR